MERDAFLARLGGARPGPALPDVATLPDVHTELRAGEDPYTRFATELAAVAGTCERCAADAVPAAVAAALGTAQVTLFGPTDPVVYAPFGARATVLRRQLACSPCYNASATAECRFGHVNCMRELQPDEVFQACVRVLAKRHGQSPSPSSRGSGS